MVEVWWYAYTLWTVAEFVRGPWYAAARMQCHSYGNIVQFILRYLVVSNRHFFLQVFYKGDADLGGLITSQNI